jgi:hypothetical protein
MLALPLPGAVIKVNDHAYMKPKDRADWPRT